MKLLPVILLLLAIIGFVINLTIFFVLQAYLCRRRSTAGVQHLEILFSSLLICFSLACALNAAFIFDLSVFVPVFLCFAIRECIFFCVSTHFLGISLLACTEFRRRCWWFGFVALWSLCVIGGSVSIFVSSPFWLVVYEVVVHLIFLLSAQFCYIVKLTTNQLQARQRHGDNETVREISSRLNRTEFLVISFCFTLGLTGVTIFDRLGQLFEHSLIHFLSQFIVTLTFISFPPAYFLLCKQYKLTSNATENPHKLTSNEAFQFPEISSRAEDNICLSDAPTPKTPMEASPIQDPRTDIIERNTTFHSSPPNLRPEDAAIRGSDKLSFCHVVPNETNEKRYEYNDGTTTKDETDSDEECPSPTENRKGNNVLSEKGKSDSTGSSDTNFEQAEQESSDSWSVSAVQDNASLSERIEKYRVKDSCRQLSLGTMASLQEEPATKLTPLDLDSEKVNNSKFLAGLTKNSNPARSSISPTVIVVNSSKPHKK